MIKYYSALKKYERLAFVTTWMKVENIMVSEIKPGKKDKYHMFSLIYRS